MSETSVMLFDTALGRCGIAWGAGGIVAVSFPEVDDDGTLARLRRRAAGAVEAAEAPEAIATVISGIRKLSDGGDARFGEAPLDFGGVGDFERSVYDLTRRIAPGEIRTYGEIARELGDVALSRRVGQALGNNPFPIVVPCHRVVGAGGTMTGFSAPGGTETKRRLLKIEGAIGPDLLDLMGG
ncbi:methylated-DNA--[protein]-cysteine S-methyltransferase [Oricola thermophila]|uniref:Methylated-DNA--[protein]-cysteine S-methyltransferase n=1 Tax=Oricola thermophila TaxID=2742145 RepID=A0A6N1VE68_9HYPH|nr:methylated-DNA--[protein]-cysteine S-methyltransferase [Oricola thermophila]QKV19230.1 methylated-DNA--[protein]-cysteine S-methyltransferase [Oricola thermophila]